MAVIGSDIKIERLSRYLFNAPSWPASLLIIIVLGLVIDGASFRIGHQVRFLGTLAFTIPAIVGFLLTKPMVNLLNAKMTWNRSALLALTCDVLAVIITLSGLVASSLLLPLFYAISLGFIFGLRLFVLVAIADYRMTRMLLPAITHSLAGILLWTVLFLPSFLFLALTLQLVFGLGVILLIWFIERPLYRAFNIKGLNFLNTFIAHLTDGSKRMEDFFREIGEEVYVPQVSIFFRREGKRGLILTVPNVHPGPMGEIGGGNLPRHFQSAFEEMVMVPHGSATHDFNLVSEDEIRKIIAAVRPQTIGSQAFSGTASRSKRYTYGSVSIVSQVIDNTLLLVSTRSPERTEDLDFSLGMGIMAEGHRSFPHIAFIDAHNCFTGDITTVHPGTLVAMEYMRACTQAIDESPDQDRYPLSIGIAHALVPFTRDQGFGDLGIQVLVVETGGQKTAYLLIDGNNIMAGVREILRDRLLAYVDEAEVMTTDSHVVNTMSGKNPVGLRISADLIIPYIEEAIQAALTDLSPAEAAGNTVLCERIVVFGSHRVAQMASTVNTVILFIPPLAAAILLLAFLLSILAYIVIG